MTQETLPCSFVRTEAIPPEVFEECYVDDAPKEFAPIVSPQAAVERVRALPEVQAWMKGFRMSCLPAAATDVCGVPGFEAELVKSPGGDDEHRVWVYASLETHAATFGYYYVNPRNGEVTIRRAF